ncbi:MAG: hypothetical protein JXB49_23210, partial [Bacteroidales bacterium]|nr:hypothetical protein [Bacteroidales bacterium]
SVIRFGSMIIIGFKSKLWPLGLQHLKAIIATLLPFLVVLILPINSNFYVDIILRSGIFSVIFVITAILFNVSDNINLLYLSIKKFFLSK